MKKRVMLILSCLLLSIGFISAQTKTASGRVVDYSGEPVIGASVIVKNTQIGVSTDVDGKFSIEVPAGKEILRFSLIGMKTIELKAAVNMQVVMDDETHVLGEIEIAVPYGTAKKTTFVGSAEVVNAKQIDKKSISNISQAIDASLPGVRTTSGGGQPGSGNSVIIRGIGSINSETSPLYVVDGVPFDGSLNSFNPADIESITVLKDATTGTLYGSRGSNGIIMITTKKGRKGKTNVNFKASWGTSRRLIPKYETVNAREYMELAFLAYKNDRITDGYDPYQAGQLALQDMVGPSGLGGEQYNPFNYKVGELIDPTTGKVRNDATQLYNENWIDEALRHPLREEYSLSVDGGNEDLTYTASISYLNEDGILKTTNFNRYQARVGIDNQATNWLKFGVNMNYSQTKSNYQSYGSSSSSTGNIWYTGNLMPPIYPVYEHAEDGSLILDANGNKQFDYGSSRPYASNFNPIGMLYDDETKYVRDNFSGRGGIVLGGSKINNDILKSFSLASDLAADYTNTNTLRYLNPFNGNAVGSDGRSNRDSERRLTITWNQTLKYNNTFGKHSIGAMIGHEYYAYRYNTTYAGKTGFPFGGLHELDAASTLTRGGSYEHNHKIESFFGSAKYSYNDRYYFDFSIRSDGSSRFQKDHRWGTFAAAGASWRISHEDFMKNIRQIDNLTLKVSYGSQGNDGVSSYYAWQAFYDLGSPNANRPGATASSIENKKLSWEKNTNLNIGLEGRYFNRVNLSVEFFNRKTSDLLLDYPMPLSTGFGSYIKNIGEMRNRGVEFSVNVDVIRNKDFSWRAGISGSHLKNKVLKLTDKTNIIDKSTYVIMEGKPIYSYYLVKSAGVDPLTGDLSYWAKNKNGVEYKTTNYSEALSNRQISGNRTPDLEGGFSSEFTYKGFDLSFQLNYSIGGKILDYNYSTLLGRSTTQDKTNYSKDLVNNTWKQPGDIAKYPKMTWKPKTHVTSEDLINASFLSIKNVSIGYTIPKSITSRLGINNLRVYAQGDNLALFTRLKGMDPTFNLTGVQSNYGYSSVRTFTFGLNVNF